MARRALRGGFGFFDVLPLISVFSTATTVAPFHGTGFISALLKGRSTAGGAALLGAKLGPRVSIISTAITATRCSGTSMSSGNLAPNLTALAVYVGSRGVSCHSVF